MIKIRLTPKEFRVRIGMDELDQLNCFGVSEANLYLPDHSQLRIVISVADCDSVSFNVIEKQYLIAIPSSSLEQLNAPQCSEIIMNHDVSEGLMRLILEMDFDQLKGRFNDDKNQGII